MQQSFTFKILERKTDISRNMIFRPISDKI